MPSQPSSHPSIHPSMLINPNLYRSRSNRIHPSIYQPSIYQPLPRRRHIHAYIHRYIAAWLVRRTITHRNRRRQFIVINGGDTQNLLNRRTIPLSIVTEGGLVSRESGVRAERGCQRRLPSPLDGTNDSDLALPIRGFR